MPFLLKLVKNPSIGSAICTKISEKIPSVCFLDQNSFSKIYFLFNSKLNGQKLGFNTPLIKIRQSLYPFIIHL